VANKIASVEAEMILPVKMVTTTAVLRKLKQAEARLTRVPMRSPTVAITPPRIKIAAIRMNDAVVISSYQNPQIQPNFKTLGFGVFFPCSPCPLILETLSSLLGVNCWLKLPGCAP